MSDKGTWVTINGRHVLIEDGESATDAINRSIAEQNERKKQEQIAAHKKEADRLNGKKEEISDDELDKLAEKAYKDLFLGDADDPEKVLTKLAKKLYKKGIVLTPAQRSKIMVGIGDRRADWLIEHMPDEYSKDERADLSDDWTSEFGMFGGGHDWESWFDPDYWD